MNTSDENGTVIGTADMTFRDIPELVFICAVTAALIALLQWWFPA